MVESESRPSGRMRGPEEVWAAHGEGPPPHPEAREFASSNHWDDPSRALPPMGSGPDQASVLAVAAEACAAFRPYLRWNRSTRPSLSINF